MKTAVLLRCRLGLVQDAGQQTIDSSSNVAIESDWQVAVNQAAELAKAQGKLPANIETAIGIPSRRRLAHRIVALYQHEP